jgi:iron complex transport system substrate-binding protein
MKRHTRTLAAFAAALSLIAACSDDSGESQAPAAPETPAATEAEVPAPEPSAAPGDTAASEPADDGKLKVAERVVSLSPTATEILFAIGAGELVIAVDANSNFPAEAPVTDLSGFEPNVEAIAAFEPDLVVISDDMGNVVAGLEALDIPVLQQPAAISLDDTYAQIEQIGAATGFIAQSADLVKEMQTDIEALLADVPASDAPLTYYHELDPTFYTATSATFIGQIYASFGLVNIADATSKPDEDFGYPQLSPEYIVEQNPSLIFLADVKCCDANAASVAARPGWSALSAVNNGGVVELDDDIASRWGPRVVDQYKIIADALAKLSVG